jgi:hypothetical protein
MNLHDPNFLTFNGEPVPGMVPPRLDVEGNVTLSLEQAAGVEHAYKVFCDAKLVSIIAVHQQQAILEDGTLIEMGSIQGRDFVHVTPPPPAPQLILDSLFLSVPCNFASPDAAADPKFSKTWKFRGKTDVPHTLKPSRVLTDAAGVKQHPGNLTWWSDGFKANGKPVVVSWYGKATRYGTFDYYGRGQQFVSQGKQTVLYGPGATSRTAWPDAFKPAVWTNGIKHKVQKIVAGSPVDVPVMSAALRRVAGASYLYVVTYESTALIVSRGHIDPYKPSAVTVAALYTIGFTIDTTLTSSTYWQALMQPLYFNASADHCAGLVSASDGKLRTIVVDIDGGTTTLDGSLTTSTNTVNIISETGTYPDYTGITDDPATWHDVTASGTAQYEVIDLTQRVGGVDYVGDTLTIAILEFSNRALYDASGSYDINVTTFVGSTMAERTLTMDNTYRVFIYGTATVLATKASSPVVVDIFHAENGSDYTDSSGFHTMALSDPIIVNATIEGGDLRNGCVVVAEYVEVGTSAHTSTFTANTPSVTAGWQPGVFFPHSGNPLYIDSYLYTSQSTSKGRQVNLRLAVWKSGTQLDVGAYGLVQATSILSSYSQGATGTGGHLLPFLPTWRKGGGNVVLSATGPTTAAFDTPLPDTATYSVGLPYVNTCAFSPDDAFGFYNVGAGYTSITTTFDVVGAFIIAGTKIAMDPADFVPAAIRPDISALASPIFLDNVPESL